LAVVFARRASDPGGAVATLGEGVGIARSVLEAFGLFGAVT
jgi:hypothetical protein